MYRFSLALVLLLCVNVVPSYAFGGDGRPPAACFGNEDCAPGEECVYGMCLGNDQSTATDPNSGASQGGEPGNGAVGAGEL